MIFRDNKLGRQFMQNGFCVIGDFLGESDLAAIGNLYDELNLVELHEIYSNIKDRPEEVNSRIDATLVSIFRPSLEKHFVNYRTGGGAFLVKGTGESSVSSLHQDWNVVDESKFVSMCVWCPLIDVDESNGCIQVVRGSHGWFRSLRSINMPSICVDFDKVESRLEAIPVKRGSAVIFAHNSFHGSRPNYSGRIRPAASVSVMNRDADMVHYYRNGDVIEILNAETFFNDTVHLLLKEQKADLTRLGIIDYKSSYNVTHDEFYRTYRRHNSIWKRLFG